MGRAAVIAAVLLVCAADARADDMGDAIDAMASIADNDCPSTSDMAARLLSGDAGIDLDDDQRAAVEIDQSLLAMMCTSLRDDAESAQDTHAQLQACTEDCDDLNTAMWFVVKKAQVEAQAVLDIMKRQQAILTGEAVVDDQPTEPSSEQHTITLSTIGVSIEVPSGWDVSAGNGADLISRDGDDVGAVMAQSEYDCATTLESVGNNYEDHRDVTISLPYTWSGIEYAVGGAWAGLFCRDGDGSAVVVSAPAEIAEVLISGIEAALSPTSDDTSSDPYVAPIEPDPDPTPETPHHRTWIGGFMPRTAQLGLVRRADEMGSGFGFGLQLGRLGWREGERYTIGYEVAAAAASGFWDLSAQVRPGVSPMLSDLPVDAYVALGVEAIGGSHQAETDVAPVGGVGAEVLFTLPGLGADLSAQVLADPGGLHSYTLHGGLLFGAEEGRVRVGTSYVRYADDANVLWFTLGMTVLELQ